MLLFPFLAAIFVKGDCGMAICFLLFLGVNPLYFVLTGAYSGTNLKRLWYLPLIAACLFLARTWIFFDMGETSFLIYAAAYLLIAVFAMLLSIFVCRKTKSSHSGQ